MIEIKIVFKNDGVFLIVSHGGVGASQLQRIEDVVYAIGNTLQPHFKFVAPVISDKASIGEI